MVKVIIAITTYNLEKYISQALDSVLAQKTNFAFKIIVADDHSIDRTPEILAEYKNKFPEIIDVLYSEKNLGSLANSNRVFDGIDCEYFSFLDGDDYWVDCNRLQKQVDFLDSHNEYSMCGGNTQFLKKGELSNLMIEKKFLDKEYSFKEDILKKMPFVHTSSLLVRNVLFKNGLPSYFKEVVGTFEECAVRGENFRRLIHLQTAPLYLMDGVFSVYRIHEAGIWQGSSPVHRIIESAVSANFNYKFFKSSYADLLKPIAQKAYENAMMWLLANRYLLHPNTLDPKDSLLLTGLIKDVSKSEKGNLYPKSSKLKFYTIKILTEILHFF